MIWVLRGYGGFAVGFVVFFWAMVDGVWCFYVKLFDLVPVMGFVQWVAVGLWRPVEDLVVVGLGEMSDCEGWVNLWREGFPVSYK
jgi:hypothetical protein